MDRDLISHLPMRKQRELQHVLRLLFDAFEEAQKGKLSDKNKHGRILKIILFGSHARGDWVEDNTSGYYSDFDLLVVVNAERFVDEADFWHGAQDSILRDELVTKRLKTPVNFIVHSLADLNSQLAQGLPFFVDITRDGIALYEVEGYPLTQPALLNAEERQAKARLFFAQWSASADEFLDLAGDAAEKGYDKKAAFLLHQTTESLYHCVLLVLTLYSPKLHSLRKLRSKAESLDPRLRDIWPAKDRLTRRCFDRLHRAYVEARYSADYHISDDELRWLFTRIRLLRDTVSAICQEALASS